AIVLTMIPPIRYIVGCHSSCPVLSSLSFCIFFFFNDTATTEIYTLSLHDALPISLGVAACLALVSLASHAASAKVAQNDDEVIRSEEHTSELQSRRDLVCRLLLEKKKKKKKRK